MRFSNSTDYLFSGEVIRNTLANLFPESVLIKKDLTVMSINKGLVNVLGYGEQELVGKPIDQLLDEQALQKLKINLTRAYFTESSISLRGKSNREVECSVHGFYLALISELNDTIVLTIRPKNEALVLHKQLEKSRKELDEFMYRAAHDLRGPLATIRGLINLMKIQNLKGEAEELLAMMDACATQLDERLFNLHYLTESVPITSVDYTLDCSLLESTLRSTLEENVPINEVELQFHSSKANIRRINSEQVTSMLNHLMLYLISLSRASFCKLVCSLSLVNEGISLSIDSLGFISTYQIREAVAKKKPPYTNIVTYSHLINFYAALKAAHKINASIDIHFIQDDQQRISIFVPYTPIATS